MTDEGWQIVKKRQRPKKKKYILTPEERQKVQIRGAQFTKEYPDPESPINENYLKGMIESKERYTKDLNNSYPLDLITQ